VYLVRRRPDGYLLFSRRQSLAQDWEPDADAATSTSRVADHDGGLPAPNGEDPEAALESLGDHVFLCNGRRNCVNPRMHGNR